MAQTQLIKVNKEALEASKQSKQKAVNNNQIVTKNGKNNHTNGTKR